MIDDSSPEIVDDAVTKNPHLEFSCKFLRTKTMFYDFNRENALSIGPACDTMTFWCVLTGTQTGPDGESANRNECGAHRSCCKS
ncbi:MAG: hypothetical protein HY286_07625 [Planctomycetes bacterium]|nr:hypothetical protein [Planctomycetota bacterium]